MSQRLSMNARRAATDRTSAEVEVVLIVIEHPELDAPIRLSTDPTERLSVEPLLYGTRSSWMGAEDPYLFVLASAEVPSDLEDAPATASIRLELIDPSIARALRSVTSPATAHLAVVLASSPDLIEMEFRDMRASGASGSAEQASIEISRRPIEDERIPTDRFTRDRFPGLFR